MIERLKITLLLAVSLMLCSQPVSATSGSATSVGAFLTGAAVDTGSREWIDLVGVGGLLSGRPKRTSLTLITVYAPGCESGHLLLRELVSSEGRRSLLLTAPAPLVEKTRRVTLYVKSLSKQLVLLEYIEGSWQYRRPQPMRVAAKDSHDASQEDLLVFSVARLGLYWLLEDHAPELSVSTIGPLDPSASHLLGGGVSRGFLPWVWSVVLLILGWAISHWVHRAQQPAGT